MYLTRNQAGVYSASGVRIPPSPPDTQNAPNGAFCVSGGEGDLDLNPRRRRGSTDWQDCRSGQPQAAPQARSAGGVRAMDGPNQSRDAPAFQASPFARLAKSEEFAPNQRPRMPTRAAMTASGIA